MTFQDFDKQIQNVPHSALKCWEIELPYKTDFQPIIAKAREYGLSTWHIFVKQPTDDNLTPNILMWWDDKIGVTT